MLGAAPLGLYAKLRRVRTHCSISSIAAALTLRRHPCPQMWPKLVAEAKDGGADCIETYVFWNGHEIAPGQVRAPLQNQLLLCSHFTSELCGVSLW